MADETYVDKFIKQGKKETISARNLFDTYLVGDVNNKDHIYRVGFNDFFLKHRAELNSILQVRAISEKMFYKPKMLSLELYGTTELWLAILRANNMKSTTEFHSSIVRVYQPEPLKELIKIYFKREKKM